MFLGEHKGNLPMPAIPFFHADSQAPPQGPLVQLHPAIQPPAILHPAIPRPAVAQRAPPLAARPVYVVRGRPGPDDRPCLPPGHPDTWGRITEGTVLDSAPYPFPIFGS